MAESAAAEPASERKLGDLMAEAIDAATQARALVGLRRQVTEPGSLAGDPLMYLAARLASIEDAIRSTTEALIFGAAPALAPVTPPARPRRVPARRTGQGPLMVLAPPA